MVDALSWSATAFYFAWRRGERGRCARQGGKTVEMGTRGSLFCNQPLWLFVFSTIARLTQAQPRTVTTDIGPGVCAEERSIDHANREIGHKKVALQSRDELGRHGILCRRRNGADVEEIYLGVRSSTRERETAAFARAVAINSRSMITCNMSSPPTKYLQMPPRRTSRAGSVNTLQVSDGCFLPSIKHLNKKRRTHLCEGFSREANRKRDKNNRKPLSLSLGAVSTRKFTKRRVRPSGERKHPTLSSWSLWATLEAMALGAPASASSMTVSMPSSLLMPRSTSTF